MTTLQWDDALLLDLPELDTIHREFVDLMAQAQDAPDEQLLAQWQHIIGHTEEHFGLEDRWMRAAGFAPDNCHMHQHHSVLEILREAQSQAAAGNLQLLRDMLPDLAKWFNYHARTMDAALVYHLQTTGFDIHSVPEAAAAPEGAGGAAPNSGACGCSGSSAQGASASACS